MGTQWGNPEKQRPGCLGWFLKRNLGNFRDVPSFSTLNMYFFVPPIAVVHRNHSCGVDEEEKDRQYSVQLRRGFLGSLCSFYSTLPPKAVPDRPVQSVTTLNNCTWPLGANESLPILHFFSGHRAQQRPFFNSFL